MFCFPRSSGTGNLSSRLLSSVCAPGSQKLSLSLGSACHVQQRKVLCGSCESGVSQACPGLFAENSLPGQPPRWWSPTPMSEETEAESRSACSCCQLKGVGLAFRSHTPSWGAHSAFLIMMPWALQLLATESFSHSLSQALQCPGNQSGRGCFLVCSYSGKVLLPRSHGSEELPPPHCLLKKGGFWAPLSSAPGSPVLCTELVGPPVRDPRPHEDQV